MQSVEFINVYIYVYVCIYIYIRNWPADQEPHFKNIQKVLYILFLIMYDSGDPG